MRRSSRSSSRRTSRQLEQQRSDPIALGSQAYNRTTNPWPKGHPRYTATFDESVADYTAVKLADAQSFYAQFLGGSSGELAIVGDFDPAEVTTLLVESLGKLEEPDTVRARTTAGVRREGHQSSRSRRPTRPMPSSSRARPLKLRDDDPGLRRDGAGQLHRRRRLPQFPPHDPDPPEGRPELLRRFAVLCEPARPVRRSSSASRSTPRRMSPSCRRPTPRSSTACCRTGSRPTEVATGEGRLPAVAAALALAGQRARPGAGAGRLPRPDAGVGCRARDEGARR